MKRFLCILLCLILCINIGTTKTKAALIFGANDYVHEYEYGHEPLYFFGQIYVPYTYFLENLGVMCLLNNNTSTLLLYTSNHVITFDLTANTIHDEQLNSYNGEAVYKDSVIYVPVQTVCQIFGFNVSVIYYGQYDIVRVTNGKQSLSNDLFKVLVSIKIGDITPSIPENNTNTNTNTNTNIPTTDKDIPAVLQNTEVNPVFIGNLSKYSKEFIDELDEVSFFVDDSISQNEEILRYIYINQHSIGIYVPKENQESLESVLEYINKVNELLFENLNMKTRMVILENNNRYDSSLQQYGFEKFDIYINNYNQKEMLNMKDTSYTIVNITDITSFINFRKFCYENMFVVKSLSIFN